MKIMIVHNEYGVSSGEETAVQTLIETLQNHDHEVIPFIRSSAEIPEMTFGRVRAFFSGIYSFSSRKTFSQSIQQYKPDIIHVHNVFPLISPSILAECRRADIPVIMSLHNYRLICPHGLLAVDGQVCDRCIHGREYWCVFRNCEGDLFKSAGYALRNYVARKRKFYLDNVTIFLALTEFQRQMLVEHGFPADRILTVPNSTYLTKLHKESHPGDYIGFIGRISPEKGITMLLAAARKNAKIPFKVAGAHEKMPHVLKEAPSNIEFLGHISNNRKDLFYRNSRVIILCSVCFESFGNTLIEAMSYGKPVVASRLAGIPEIVDHDTTGLLFETGNADDLAEKIRYLWERPELCHKMGQAGREKVLQEYSPKRYYERVLTVYEKAIRLGPGGPNHKS